MDRNDKIRIIDSIFDDVKAVKVGKWQGQLPPGARSAKQQTDAQAKVELYNKIFGEV